jgi:predicted GNAT family acetyltransferase
MAFWELTSDFLLRDPVLNGVLLTTISARRTGAMVDPAPATYAAVLDARGWVMGAAMRTPPFNIYVSPMPVEAVDLLVDAMVAACPDAGGVTGTAAEAAAFASAWAERTGSSLAVQERQRIHRLDAVTMPAPVPGSWRTAGPSDRDLLVEWTEAFAKQTGSAVAGTGAANVDSRLAEDRAFVWLDGVPVSYVGTSTPAGGIVRIGPVYTPPERRRRGYASALVALVSQRALNGGAVACSLYTDLANPTSNKIYAAIGYRPVRDVTVYRFTGVGA